MSGKKGQKKRFWSDDEKVSICGQTRAPRVSVALLARRYAMNANLIYTWLRDPRFAPACTDGDDFAGEVTTFLPVEIAGPTAPHVPITAPCMDGPLSAHRADITLSDGRRILVEGAPARSQDQPHRGTHAVELEAGITERLSLRIVCMDVRWWLRGKPGVRRSPVQAAGTIAGSCRDIWSRRLGSAARNPSTGCVGC